MKLILLRRFIFFSSIVFGFNISSVAQKSEITDSLWHSYQLEKIDTTKIKILISIGDFFKQTNPDSAIIIYKKTLDYSMNIKSSKFITKSLNFIGVCYTYKGMYDSSFYYFGKRLKIEETLQNKEGISDCYYNIAYIYNLKGLHKNALEYLFKTLKIKEELNDRKKIASCYLSIGNVHFKQKEYHKAIEYYSKSLAINIEFDNIKDISIIYTNLGCIYVYEKKYDKALELNLKALKTFESLNRIQDIALIYSNIGSIFQNKGELNTALEYYNKSLKLYESIHNKDGISTIYIFLSDLFKIKKEYSQAIILAQKGLEIAKSTGLLFQQREAYENLSSNYDSIHDFINAYKYFKLFKNLNDSIYNVENNRQIQEMSAQYENEQKQNKIELLNKENELHITQTAKYKISIRSSIIGIILLVIFTLVLNNRLKINNRNKQIIEQQNEELKTHTDNLELYQNHLEKLVQERTENLRIAKEKAEESDNLKTAFLNNISHEIRTPLNAIVGFSGLITICNQSVEKQKQFSEIISKSSNKLIGIVTDIIEISQISANQVLVNNSIFDFIQLVNDIINEYKTPITNKNIDLTIKIEPNYNSHEIISDKHKLHQIIKHLLDNAEKFTHKGSIILDFSISDDNIEFTIADTGIGILKDMQEIIFKPFRQIEIGKSRNYGGNGVGLAIIKGYVDILDGSIAMQTEFNIGTTFSVKIPIQTVSKIENSPKTTQNLLKKVDTILIVEDESSNYEYLFEILQSFCTNILYASNGQQAIEICRNITTIDFVLMDIKMPIMDGHMATKLIKAFRPEIPIIAQTAYALEGDKESFLESGFDDYICKPIKNEILFATIDKYINR
jgi:signal transduction histidine kinase/CheY-like chemotaxis protein